MPFQAKNAFEKHVKAKALITFYFAKYRSKAKNEDGHYVFASQTSAYLNKEVNMFLRMLI